MAPVSLGSIGWKWILDSLYSVINWVLVRLHLVKPLDVPMWLGQPTLAMISVILVHTWHVLPFSTVILLAGWTAIPQDIPEAAAVDGAGYFRTLFQVTLPMMLPIINVALLFGVIFTFTDMTVIYILTRGGPYDTTQVLPSLAFFTGILGGDLAEGAAISLFLVPLLSVAAWLMLRVGAPRRGDLMALTRRGVRVLSRTFRWAVLVGFSAALAFPFYWMLITTFKSSPDLYNLKNNPFLFSERPTLEHLRLLFGETLFLRWFANTVLAGCSSSRSRSRWRCPPRMPSPGSPDAGANAWESGSS